MKLLIILILLQLVLCEWSSASNFADKENVYNEEHLKMHLEDQMEMDEKKMTPDEERYHYFSMADSNRDGVIDGVEVPKAIHHDHEKGEQQSILLSDNEVEKEVEDVMKIFDLDGNGAIDYSEYIKGIQREE